MFSRIYCLVFGTTCFVGGANDFNSGNANSASTASTNFSANGLGTGGIVTTNP